MKDETLLTDEQAVFEKFMEENFGDSIDRRHVKNGDGGYFSWDMVVAWIVWQGRAAIQSGNSGQVPAVSDGWIPVSDDAEPPREGWLLTHKGRDYFYRNQDDAVAYMNAAIDANDGPLSILHMEHNDGPVVVPDDRLQKAIVDACIVFLHGCDSLSKNYECDFGDAETEHSFCMAEVAKKAGVVEETGNRRWSLCKEMKGEIEDVYRKYAMRIMEAAPKVKP